MADKSALKPTKNPLKRTLDAMSAEGPPSKRLATDGTLSKSRVSSPFRSPLMSLTNSTTPASIVTKNISRKDHVFAVPAVPAHAQKLSAIPSHVSKRTAGSPFKSPLMLKPSSGSSVSSKLPSAAPSPQQRLETLRRAVRLIKEDESLKCLIQKWRTVGREAATDLCALIAESGMAENGSGEATDSGGMTRDKGSQNGGYDNSWGFGPPTQGRFDKSWGWLDADVKPESGWGWATVAEHVENGEVVDSGLEGGPPEDEELPSPSKLERILGMGSHKPVVKRRSLLSPTMTASDFLLSAPPDDEVGDHTDSHGDDGQGPQEGIGIRPWGMARMLRELGIPQELLGWNEEAEDWVERETKR